ncbi:GL26452 [Drosophila persimilis]|uniref:GL26452 n=1 Tax=Drosophila persimilis TaxID=7234 RepID=B4GSN9_DROPE|nr:TATA box-binding protein-like protein 2 [Drosophila persimilis]EDW25398.1 GL26452 [Drosophila persimilis]
MSANKETPTDDDVVNIFSNLSVLPDIERHLQLLYRPFTCFVNTKCVYDLHALFEVLGNSRYEPEKHSALFVQRVYPVCNLTIYANGNIFCKAYSRDGARDGLSKFEEILELLGYTPAFYNFQYNVVNATFCVPFPLDLEWLKLESYSNIISDKSQPFIFHIMPKTGIKFAIFPTGFVYVLGCRQPNETNDAIAFILPILYRFKAETKRSQQDLSLSLGDISSSLHWEREFQKEQDLAMTW